MDAKPSATGPPQRVVSTFMNDLGKAREETAIAAWNTNEIYVREQYGCTGAMVFGQVAGHVINRNN